MKLIVRTLVIALALTGAIATTAATHANASSVAAKASFSKTSAMPVPSCDPSDTSDCGM